MRWLSFLLAVSTLMGCGAKDWCGSIALGQKAAGLPLSRLEGTMPFGLPGLLSPVDRAPFTSSSTFDHGEVEHHLCCFSQAKQATFAWCEQSMLECSAPEYQGVELAYVKEPYSEQNSPDWGYFCFVAIKDDTIVAVFSRYWS